MSNKTALTETTERNALFAAIVQCLDEMPELMRRAFVLRRYHRHSLAQVAEKTGLSEWDLASMLYSADRRLQRALRHLRTNMASP